VCVCSIQKDLPESFHTSGRKLGSCTWPLGLHVLKTHSHIHILCQAKTQAHTNTLSVEQRPKLTQIQWAYTHTHQGVWIGSLSILEHAWDVRARFFLCSYRMWVHFQLCNRASHHNALWKKSVHVILKPLEMWERSHMCNRASPFNGFWKKSVSVIITHPHTTTISLPTDAPRHVFAHTCKLLRLHQSRSMTRKGRC
jgi:hypothetical protein